ncbi:MAG: rRNA maturation RNase YbeY [Oscillatoriales cyanobacterium RM1_1_9]|nr:rRNA maturation RNase YbeY [Oscillatoriales cyanobacterium SM2_3_0]NJO47519.1 rRNA maturation RNase YbeY [Oscillatoriales cyanobacterium RM2_1_1]NJO71781.1 rRNA maturation RNase YbeY [Oscillatoriales cyanobacterium RM1_1_9]
MQTEVNIQDYFWPVESRAILAFDSASPISVEEWQQWFQRWLEILQSDLEIQAYEVSLRLTDDAEIQDFNTQYRHKNQPTDVLAFATFEVESPKIAEVSWAQPLYLGDIVISVETAAYQAGQQGHSLRVELAWLASHGLLHLLGWDHPDDISLAQMLAQQQTLLQSIGLEASLRY